MDGTGLLRTPPRIMVERPTGFLAAVTRVQNQILHFWDNEAEDCFSAVGDLARQFYDKKNSFTTACKQRLEVSDASQEEKDEFLRWFQEKGYSISVFEEQLNQWLKEREEMPPSGNCPTGSVSGITSRSGTSYRSGTSSARARLAEKKAKLKAHRLHEKQLSDLKEKQIRLQQEAELAKHKLDQQVAEAHMKRQEKEAEILEQELDKAEGIAFHKDLGPTITQSSAYPGVDIQVKVDEDYKNDNMLLEPDLKPVMGNLSSNSFNNENLARILDEQNRISVALVRNQESSFLPRHEPVVFDGTDITKFKTFLSAFHTMIEGHCRSDADKFYFLEKYTAGLPQRLVQGFNDGDPARAFHLAMKSLKEQYGNEFAIAQTYIKKLENWPSIRSEDIEENFERLYSEDFADSNSAEQGLSVEDQLWFEKVNSSIHWRPDGYLEVDLPFRHGERALPCNLRQVGGQLQGLRKRFLRDPDFFNEYQGFINGMLEKKFMERVPLNEINAIPGKVWFLTHFAVYHRQKNKIRVVFDCSLKNAGISLNDRLLQGPDLINNLQGILLRFRQERIAFMADVEQMYFQVRVPPQHADFLRILWFPEGDLHQEPVQFRLTSHIFGAVSSPSVANYALRHTATLGTVSDEEVKEVLERDFYVDDLIKAVETPQRAISLIRRTIEATRLGNFNLTGFVSNSREVLDSIPREKLAKGYRELDFDRQELPQDRALGMKWLVEEDCIGFKIMVNSQKGTRRGVLSTVSSIYDPLGLAGPVIVEGRAIFQETCRRKLEWDDYLPEDLSKLWNRWTSEVPKLEDFRLRRSLRPADDEVVDVQLHIFCDGSVKAYGAVAYARFTAASGLVQSTLIMSKVRLTPIGNTALKTIPRIELNGARLAVCLSQVLQKEMTLKFSQEFFWTDSLTVLKYIGNETSRFQRFVANRVSFIRGNTRAGQWRYVPGNKNIADLISRGASVTDFLHNQTWISGPQFLVLSEEEWPETPHISDCYDSKMEVIKDKVVCATVMTIEQATDRLLGSSSDWFRILYRVAAMLRLQKGLRRRGWTRGRVSCIELKGAENAVWRYLQHLAFSSQIDRLEASQPLKKGDPLEQLMPEIDPCGLLRVGGRLSKSSEEDSTKHPLILSGKHPLVQILVRQCHKEVGHMGHHYVLSVLRQKYWIIGGNSVCKVVVRNCIGCRRRHGRPGEQVMASLPVERVTGGNPPFWHTGVDYFGPFLVTRGRSRSQEKRYGVVFTCLTSRAIHLEVSFTLDTSSFINSMRRFISRRGQVGSFNSDNGTNLVGACRELKESLDAWNQDPIHEWCLQRKIEWKFHPPLASHFGGCWEREIRTARQILQALISNHHRKLNDEDLQTFMCEAEGILNNRPLTCLSGDPSDNTPLTPQHLLLLRQEPMLPPGNFDLHDTYGQQRWKHIQYLADQFWLRWRKEYLLLLQERKKWNRVRRSLKVGDLVLVMDVLLPRNQWCLGRVVEVTADDSGNVRAARVKISKCKLGRNLNVSTTEVLRPIAKLVLLKETEEEN